MSATRRAYAETVLIGLVAFCIASAADAFSFQDDFGDGVVDAAFWRAAGDGVSESGGTLRIRRNNVGDSVGSASTFSGPFDIRFEVQLDRIAWNDMFHGITLMSSASYGISFGFSMYQQFYSAEHNPNGVSFYYTGGLLDPPAFVLNRWYSIRIVGSTGGSADLYVDGTRVFTRDLRAVSDFSILLPGHYEDGDGMGIGDNDTTDSRIDNFRLDVAGGPPSNATEIPTLSEWGLITLGVVLALCASAVIRIRNI